MPDFFDLTEVFEDWLCQYSLTGVCNPEIWKFRSISRILRKPEVNYTSHKQRNFFNMCLDKFFGFLNFRENISNWLTRDEACPTNTLHLATECNNKNHSAAFPEGLPEWFIKLFAEVGDTVLDPFIGSGATNIVANGMRRNSIGIEIIPKNSKMVISQISHVELYLFESQAKHGTD